MGEIKDNIHKDAHEQLEIIAISGTSDCGCSTTSCCDESGTPLNRILQHMSVTIDGKVIEVTSFDKNIVDVASRAKIRIPAPCYHTQRKNGCCSACVVEIDDEQKFACSTVPENGMNIVVDRADLKAIRKQNLLEYKEGIKSGNPCVCSVSGSSDCCS
jgi:predicted molibdopterin-dependent oxidoreductase YjgC